MHTVQSLSNEKVLQSCQTEISKSRQTGHFFQTYDRAYMHYIQQYLHYISHTYYITFPTCLLRKNHPRQETSDSLPLQTAFLHFGHVLHHDFCLIKSSLFWNLFWQTVLLLLRCHPMSYHLPL